MSITAERTAMAKRPGRPKGERDDTAIRVSRPMARKMKAIADHRGISVGELADDLFEKIVDRAFAAVLRELDKANGGDTSSN